MPSFTITVDDVKSRDVRTKDGRDSKIYQIFDDRGIRWETWKKQLANEAYRMVGQQARITGRVEMNGEYENHYLDDIVLLNDQVDRDYHQSDRPNYVEQAQRAQPERESTRWEPTGKDWAIFRQVATKVSAHLSTGPGGSPNDFWENLGALVAYMAYGQIPSEYQNAPAPRREEPMEPSRSRSEDFDDPGPEPGKPAYSEFEDLPF